MSHIFYLRRDTDVYSAEVTAIEHPYHQIYHVLFADGYENNFFKDVETGTWIEEDLGETQLAANFGIEVSMQEGELYVATRQLVWVKAAAAGKIISFGYYSYEEGITTNYEVYSSNRKFLNTFKSQVN